MKKRSPEGEARRLAALRSPEVRIRISEGLKGKTPSNFLAMQEKAWAANRKEVLTYSGIHAWVRRNWGRATRCESCGRENLSGHSVHWSNLDHKYLRERSDWKMMCRTCHATFDQKHNGTSFAKKSIAAITHCPYGHAYTPENTQVAGGSRRCRTCGRLRAAEQRRRKREQSA